MHTLLERAVTARAAHLAMACRAVAFVAAQLDARGAPDPACRPLVIAGASPREALGKTLLDRWTQHHAAASCGAQSALAFIHLRDAWKARPLDWMRVGDFVHGFVVIGRSVATVATSIRSWNAEAVICDPWHGVACPADQARWLMGETIEPIYRLA
jgi:hypothetical protein